MTPEEIEEGFRQQFSEGIPIQEGSRVVIILPGTEEYENRIAIAVSSTLLRQQNQTEEEEERTRRQAVVSLLSNIDQDLNNLLDPNFTLTLAASRPMLIRLQRATLGLARQMIRHGWLEEQ